MAGEMVEKYQEVSIQSLKSLISALWDVKKEIELQKKILSDLNSQKEDLEGHIIRTMQVVELDRFDIDKCSVFKQSKKSVRVPSDPEKRSTFFDYLKSRELFDSMITVNANTLKSWFNKEVEVQIANGRPDFQVPGLDEPTPYWDLSVRAK